jgi:diguanylate cyclase (GGDEF)-like protein
MTITHPDDVAAKDEDLGALSLPSVSCHRHDKRLVHADGRVVWVESSTSLVRDAQGDPLHMVVQIQDISARKGLDERMEHFASVDALTGMRNRRLFEEDLHTQVARCQRYGEEAALLILDLDDFKKINDTYGHKIGDEVLKAVAAVLKKRVRSGDQAARLGGDEFGVLLCNITLAQAEAVVVDLHRDVTEARVTIGGEGLSSRVSIGIAGIDEHATDADAILAAADSSMYAAKRAAQNASRRATLQLERP